jgi:hypothetical protein
VNYLLEDMKGKGVSEGSESTWSLPVVLVWKKEATLASERTTNGRMTSLKDCIPFPRINDNSDMLARAKLFTILGLKSGYWQVAPNPNDKENMAFSTSQGMWQFTVMPFGLCNAPETFKQSILRGLTYDACPVYLDHVTDIGRTFQEQFTNLQKVFQRLREVQLKLNTKKCQLFWMKLLYLSHTVSSLRVTTDPEKLEAVKNWPRLTDKHQLRGFLWLFT